MSLGALESKPRVFYLLPGSTARSTMSLRLLRPVPHSATQAPGETPLSWKQKGKQNRGETRKEKRKKMEKKVQVLQPPPALCREV
jgi:hypothetical protein